MSRAYGKEFQVNLARGLALSNHRWLKDPRGLGQAYQEKKCPKEQLLVLRQGLRVGILNLVGPEIDFANQGAPKMLRYHL